MSLIAFTSANDGNDQFESDICASSSPSASHSHKAEIVQEDSDAVRPDKINSIHGTCKQEILANIAKIPYPLHSVCAGDDSVIPGAKSSVRLLVKSKSFSGGAGLSESTGSQPGPDPASESESQTEPD